MKFLLKRRIQKEERQPPSQSSVSPTIVSAPAVPASTNLTAPPSSNCRSRSPVRNSATLGRRASPVSAGDQPLPSDGVMHQITGYPGGPLAARGPLNCGRSISPPSRPSESAIVSSSLSDQQFVRPELSFEDIGAEQKNPFSDLPLFKDVQPSECHDLLRRKLLACCTVYEFNRQTNHKAKEAKRLTLLELVDYINNTKNCFTEPIMQAVVQMVSANIFRALTPPSSNVSFYVNFDPDEDEPVLESAWPHLQIVYEFFLRFVVSNEVDAKAAKRYIDQQFVLRALELFSSEDSRERDYLKTIIHRIYGKIMALRSFIRKAIQNTFYGFVYEQECHKGVSELLEILGSIINGFALPLKEEHKLFLEKSLIPLHKARSLSTFNQQLTYCMAQYVEKDNRLAETIILGLLKFWPMTNTNKEVVFLHELEEILDLTQPAEFQKVMEPLFRQLALCIQSPHFQVAERVLFLWNNEYVVNLFNSNKQHLFPVIITALYKNSKDHWNNTVHSLTYNVSKLLAEANPDLFDECSDKNLSQEETRLKEEERKKEVWRLIEVQAKALTNG